MNKLFSALALGASIGATSTASAQQAAPLTFTGYVTDMRGFQSERAQRMEVFPAPRSQPLIAVFKDADENLTAVSCTSLAKRPAPTAAQKAEYARAGAACRAAAPGA